jgi:hypothetical protein
VAIPNKVGGRSLTDPEFFWRALSFWEIQKRRNVLTTFGVWEKAVFKG